MKTIAYSLFIILFISSSFLIAKPKNKKQEQVKIKSFNTQYGGKDAWKSWRVNFDKGSATLSTKYGGKDAWKSWDVILPNRKSLSISTQYGGKDAWKSWKVTGKNGSMTISTQYSGKDAWKSWRINDNLKAPLKLKISALIAIIYSGAVRNSPSKALAKSTCMLKGKKLYGKVKIVKYNPTFKVKTVTYSQNLKVKKVKYSANSCGKWEFVKYGEDFSVQFVDYGEDLKIKYVDYGEGM